MGSPIDWATESFAISVSSEVQYYVGTNAGCWYDADNERLDPGEPEKDRHDRPIVHRRPTPTVGEQLVKAGVRLAELLDRALGD